MLFNRLLKSALLKKLLFIHFVSFFLFVQTNSFARQINMDELMVMPVPNSENVCTLDPTDINAHFFIGPDREMAKNFQSAASATIEVDYRVSQNACGDQVWPDNARQAFEFAMNIWSLHLVSNIPIRIDAVWTELENTTLGSARPTSIVQLPGVGVPQTWYTLAQLSAMSDRVIRDEIDGVNHDVEININCDFSNWYFGTDASTPANRIDFVTVVVHEIGHGIGFVGSMSHDEEADDETAGWGAGSPPQPFIFDRFTEDGNNNEIINPLVYPNPSNELYQALTGSRGGIFFEGDDANLTLADSQIDRAILYTPSEFRPGSSYSHVDQATFTNTPDALMRPRIDRAFAIHTPGPLFCGMLSDMGWPIGVGCLSFLAADAFIAVSDIEIDFGVSNEGRTIQRTITIESDESSEETLSGALSTEGDNFSVTGETTFSLAPGESKQFTIQYTPQSDEQHEDTVTIFHNARNVASPILISLAGEALQQDQVVRLEQSFPNPAVAAGGTTPEIPYVLSEDADVRLDLYTVDGRHVKSLVKARLPAGRYSALPDMSGLSSGVYIYRLIISDIVESKKLMYVR